MHDTQLLTESWALSRCACSFQPIARRKRSDLTVGTPAWTASSRPQSGAPAPKRVTWACPPGSPTRTVGVRWWSRPDYVWSDPARTSWSGNNSLSSHQRFFLFWNITLIYCVRIFLIKKKPFHPFFSCKEAASVSGWCRAAPPRTSPTRTAQASRPTHPVTAAPAQTADAAPPTEPRRPWWTSSAPTVKRPGGRSWWSWPAPATVTAPGTTLCGPRPRTWDTEAAGYRKIHHCKINAEVVLKSRTGYLGRNENRLRVGWQLGRCISVLQKDPTA